MAGKCKVKTEILIVRHGESLGNINRIMLGNTDLDMSPRGYKQAEACAQFLAGEHIDAIYSSDLIRAYNTAKPHAERRGLPIIKDARLREMHVGEWENRPFGEIAETYPELHREWRESFATVVFPDGESIAEAGKRFHAALLDLGEANLGRRILIATHAGVLRSFWGQLLGLPLEKIGESLPFAVNASVSKLVYEDGVLAPVEYSIHHYLSEVGVIIPHSIGK